MKTTSWMAGKVVLQFLVFATMLTAAHARAEGTNLTELLQAGLFAEQGDHNLDAAIADYQALASQYDKDRQLAATAVFRLGECYRAQNRTNEAAAEYQRVLKDFPDQKVLATMSEQNLKGLSVAPETAPQNQEHPQAVATPQSDLETGQEAELLKLKTQYSELTNEITTIPPSRVGLVVQQQFSNEILNKLIPQRMDLAQQYQVALSDYAPSNITPVRIKSALDAVDEQIGQQIGAMVTSLEVEIALREKSLETLRAQTGQLELAGQAQSPTPVVENDEDKEIQRIQDLIQNSPDLINRPDLAHHTPLVDAAEKGWLKVAGYLLDHGAEVNPPPPSMAPLAAAADVGNRTMVEFLLKHGAQPNGVGLDGDTALIHAVEKQYATVIKVLLENGADVNWADPGGRDTAMIYAAQGAASIVQQLLDAGAAVNVESKRGHTPLNLAVQNGSPETIKLLLNAKAEVNTVAGDGSTPLCSACLTARDQESNVVSMLLMAGADPNLQDKDGRTALSYAAWTGKADCVKILLAAKADPEGGKHTPPLMAAIAAKNLQSAQLLLDAGADPNELRRFQIDPLVTTYSDFTDHRNNMSAFWLAVYIGQPDMVQLLMAHKADTGPSSDYGNSILFRTLWQTNLLSILLDAGADPNVRDIDDQYHRTPLQMAAANGYSASINLLLKHGADPNLQDADGGTALHIALDRTTSHLDGTNMVVSLLDRGANPNIRNKWGQTPLMIAGTVQFDSVKPWLVDLLHQHGALDKLPDWDRIEVTRAAANFLEPVFFKGTNDWNHFTLCETLLNCYDTSRTRNAPIRPFGSGGHSINNASPYGPQFPDFSRITIIRPDRNSTNETRITVNLLNDAGGIDGTKDVTLEFGDVVEVPERDHALGESFTGLSSEVREGLASHLRGHLSLVVKGKPTSIDIWPEPQWALLKNVLADNTARSVLLASSDLSRVKVTRHDQASGKENEWTVDCSDKGSSGNGQPPMTPGVSLSFEQRLHQIVNGGNSTSEQDMASDLWLRDGDVIEVPEKP